MISKLLLISAYEMAKSKLWIDYRLNDRGMKIWFPSCKKLSFTLLRRVRLCDLPSLRSLSRAAYPGIKRLVCEVDRSSPFSATIKNTCIKTFIHACAVPSSAERNLVYWINLLTAKIRALIEKKIHLLQKFHSCVVTVHTGSINSVHRFFYRAKHIQ
jgi:hypothetical protein